MDITPPPSHTHTHTHTHTHIQIFRLCKPTPDYMHLFAQLLEPAGISVARAQYLSPMPFSSLPETELIVFKASSDAAAMILYSLPFKMSLGFHVEKCKWRCLRPT